MHLTASPITNSGHAPWVVKHGDEIIVAELVSANFVKDAIKELKLRGVDHKTHVVILTVAGSAWNGSIEQHSA
jgi:hypothetical protein